RVDGASPARRLARCRAHPPADGGERVGGAGDEVGVAVAPFGDGDHVRAGVGVDRAGGPAGFVLPEPLAVGNRRHRHQMTCRDWSRRSPHATRITTAKKRVAARYWRVLRLKPVSLVSTALAPYTAATKPTTRMARPDPMARGQLRSGPCSGLSPSSWLTTR